MQNLFVLKVTLKGLFHEIDFQKILPKFKELDLTKGRNFLEAPMIL